MVCIKPLDGCPACALESQLFIALGFPPDSCWIIVQMSLAFNSLAGTPFCSRIWIASWIHCWTLPGGGLDGGPPLGPRPPPPPPPPPPLEPPPLEPPPPPWLPPPPPPPPPDGPLDERGGAAEDGVVVGGAAPLGVFSDENLGLKPLAALLMSAAAVPSAVLMLVNWVVMAPLLPETALRAASS